MTRRALRELPERRVCGVFTPNYNKLNISISGNTELSLASFYCLNSAFKALDGLRNLTGEVAKVYILVVATVQS